jgi:hypothetical protein
VRSRLIATTEAEGSGKRCGEATDFASHSWGPEGSGFSVCMVSKLPDQSGLRGLATRVLGRAVHPREGGKAGGVNRLSKALR